MALTVFTNAFLIDCTGAEPVDGAAVVVEDDRIKVRREYLPQFAKLLPGRKAARFYQIENKIDAFVRYDLAAEIPVVEESAAR